MGGAKRSTRLARRKSRPKYNEAETEEDDENSSKQIESDDGGESDFSGGGESDGGSLLRTGDTRAVTRRGRLDRQPKRLPETSRSPTKQPLKPKIKRQPKVESLSSDQKEKIEILLSTDDDGSDHAEDDRCDQQKGPSLKSSKIKGPNFHAPMQGKKRRLSLGENGKSPQHKDDIAESSSGNNRNSPPSKNRGILESEDAPTKALVDPASHDVDAPSMCRKVGVDQGGTEREGCVPSSLEDPESRTAKDDTRGSTPIIDSNPQQHMDSPPSLTSTSDGIERAAIQKDLTGSDMTECKDELLREPVVSKRHDSKWGINAGTAGSEKLVKPEKCDQARNNPVPSNSSERTDGEGKNEHQNDVASLVSAGDTSQLKRTTGASSIEKILSVPPTPIHEKKKNPSPETVSSKSKMRGFGGNTDSILARSNDGIDVEGPDHSKPGSFEDSPRKIQRSVAQQDHDAINIQNNVAQNYSDASAVMGVVSSGESYSNVLGEKVDAVKGIGSRKETALHETSGQTAKEIDSFPSSESHIGDSHGSNHSLTMRYPKPNQRRQAPSVDQLKMALFLEASNAHRGNGAERLFANYWEALERYIMMGSHGAIKRMRSDRIASFAGIETALIVFLKTRKMKRLHNKLLLVIMMEATKTTVSARCSSHVPEQWQTAKNIPMPIQLKKEDDFVDANCSNRESDLLQWNADFGPRSGAWTACEAEIALVKTDSGHSIRPELIASIPKAGLQEEEVLPSARLPGALEIEPMVRDHAANLGLSASENAIWMLVVAVREHSSSLIKKIIANDQDFGEGYASSLPTHFQTGLVCHHLTIEKDDAVQSSKNRGEGRQREKKVINSTSLSHVLAESPAAASRFTSMCSAATTDDGGKSSSCPALDNVNCIINASIQRGARKRQKSSTRYQNELSTLASPAHINASSSTKPDKKLVKVNAQASAIHSLSSSSLPLNKPNLAQRRKQSIPLPLPPQSQLPLPSMPSQNMQALNSSRLMSHSDHMKESKSFKQQTLPMSRADTSTLEPLTKPGFPCFTNVSQKPEPSQNSAPKTASPPPKALKRGSKNLAAMRPSSQPRTASDKDEDKKVANGVSLDKANVARQNEGSEQQNDGPKDKKDDMKESKSLPTAPSRPKSRAFGVKNLAAMRAKASDSGN